MSTWLRSRWRGALVVAVAVTMTAGLITTNVMAQTPPTPTTQTGVAQGPPLTASDFLARLAAKLGLPVDQVQSAATAAQTELIDEAVQAGRLPQEAADRLKERVAAGELVVGHGGKGGHGRGGHGGAGRGGAAVESSALATWLGITPEQLHTELQANGGQSLAQVAQAHGQSRDALIAFLTEQARTRLSEAVANGRLTQAQADEQLARFEQNVSAMVDQVHAQGEPRGPRPVPGATRTTNPSA